MISLHEVDLNLPPVIQALEHHQNVTRAGEALNMSQSALSDASCEPTNASGDTVRPLTKKTKTKQIGVGGAFNACLSRL